ncbi:MAG: Gfo/Idh/MocA family oxidoreductase [Anaerolinea sp.]|nr:Gfo/Idh/MocA family oxidoreductase [Anaerolinea sp.]
MAKINVAVIGTGNIATGYVSDLLNYPDLHVSGVTDVDAERARQFGAEHGVHVYPSTEALLADPDVQIAVNLTPHFAHKAVTEQALNAGKHVYSEKPLALTSTDAWGLVALARTRGLRLAGSPFTIIGEAQQTAWKLIRDGKLGKVRMVYAEVNWGRIESWHPAPIPFYEVGALFDVGVYQLAILTTIFGAARRVQTIGHMLLPDRVTKDGVPYTLTTPDWMVTVLELADGTRVRLTADFYVANASTRQTGIEFHGDLGSLYLESFFLADSPLLFAPFNEPLAPIELVRQPETSIRWGRGVHELASALREGRPHRFSGEHAAHITDILNAANESLRTGQPVTIDSAFPPTAPAEWAL